ncbi:MAG: hypothetical protein K2M36_02395, partial [Clostridia bacterium]|nr:hypothetical protein [Clostridia bacterium]
MYIFGRNPVKEAYRAGKTIDKLYMLKGEFDPSLNTIRTLAKEARTVVSLSRIPLSAPTRLGLRAVGGVGVR